MNETEPQPLAGACRICQTVLTPLNIRHRIPPPVRAEIAPEKLELMGLAAAVADHLQKYHREQVQTVGQICGILQDFLVMSTLQTTNQRIIDARDAMLKTVEATLYGPAAAPEAPRILEPQAAATKVSGRFKL